MNTTLIHQPIPENPFYENDFIHNNQMNIKKTNYNQFDQYPNNITNYVNEKLNNYQFQTFNECNSNPNNSQYNYLEPPSNENNFYIKNITNSRAFKNPPSQIPNSYVGMPIKNGKLTNLKYIDNVNNFEDQYDAYSPLHNGSNKNPNITSYSDLREEEIAKIAGIIAKDQSGCRLIQRRIMENPNFANDTLFYEIQYCLLDLCNDAFGNYLIQKMLEYLSPDKIEWILNLISPCFLEITFSPHGTRVIQKLIEVLYNESIFKKFNQMFLFNLLPIAKDINANHIIHKYVHNIKSPHNQELYDIINKNFVEICKDKHGCCVMQKLIDNGNSEQKVRIL